MKLPVLCAFLVAALLLGCTQQAPPTTSELALNETELQQLGLTSNADCQTEEGYSNSVDSSTGQYTFCNYTIASLNDTGVVVELKRFANYEALEGSYQYDSLHLYSIQGLISENEFGEKSRFRLNNVNDYMGHLNPPGVYFYHLWIVKNPYLIHITSGGRSQEAGESVKEIGRRILSKFG